MKDFNKHIQHLLKYKSQNWAVEKKQKRAQHLLPCCTRAEECVRPHFSNHSSTSSSWATVWRASSKYVLQIKKLQQKLHIRRWWRNVGFSVTEDVVTDLGRCSSTLRVTTVSRNECFHNTVWEVERAKEAEALFFISGEFTDSREKHIVRWILEHVEKYKIYSRYTLAFVDTLQSVGLYLCICEGCICTTGNCRGNTDHNLSTPLNKNKKKQK